MNKSKFDEETNLQDYIYHNPDSIPLYDIKEDIRLLILAREFPTKSGPIDAIGIDKDGEIYLIETKLYKNPDKRLVVAQVLDYGSSLWRNYADFDEFTHQVNNYLEKNLNTNLSKRISDFYGINDEEISVLLDSVKRNLHEGSFKFVVLMDSLHEQLKDLIIFLNQNSEFDIYAVELEYYKFQEYEIVIPKLFGSEVKKGTYKPSQQRIPTDDEFIKSYSSSSYKHKVEEIIDLFNDIREGRKTIDNVSVSKTPRYLYFLVDFSNNQDLSIYLGIDPNYESGGLQFWCDKEREKQIKKIITTKLPKATILKDMTTRLGKIAKWPLEYYSTDIFLKFLHEMNKIR